MQDRKLGKSSILIRPLGFGCAAIGGYYTRNGQVNSRGSVDPMEITRAIHTATDQGIALFDVANIYGAGDAERLLGQALAEGGRRQKAVLQVKFGASFDEVTRTQIDYSNRLEKSWIINSLHGSLRRLQTDVIDIFQFQIADYPLEWLSEVLDTLDELVAGGKIRAYSIGTGDLDRIRLFAERDHCATVIHTLNVLNDAPLVLPALSEYGVASLAGMPLYLGILSGRYNPKMNFDTDDLRGRLNFQEGRFAEALQQVALIRDILESNGRTLAQGALAWIWARAEHTVPVPGFKTVTHVESSIAALEKGPLTPDQMRQIDELLGRST